MAVKLQGKLTDITTRPVEDITSVYVKSPIIRAGDAGALTTSQPQKVSVSTSGDFTVTTVAGKGWLYVDGNGWSDSIPFVAAEGMKLFIEAWANASSSGGVYAIIKELIDAMGGATEQELQDLVQQAKMYADAASRAEAAESVWDKGMISAKTDILSLAPGRYGLMSASVASSMGLPGDSSGVLIVDYLDGPNGRLSGRFWWEYQDRTYGRICYSATSYNGTFKGWQPDNTWHKMPLTTSDKLVELPPGRYPVASEDVAKALGLPWAGMGYLEMEWLGTSAYQRVDWWTGVQPTHHWRISIYNKVLDKAAWEHLHGADAGEGSNYQLAGAEAAIEAMLTTHDPTASYESDHAALVGDLKRRVGPVNVGDAGALALVFDHGTTAFREWIWPELKKRNLVGTMALCPEVHLDDKGDSRHRATNDEIKSWVKDGLVIAGHSGDHELSLIHI